MIWIKKARTSLSFSCRQFLPARFLSWGASGFESSPKSRSCLRLGALRRGSKRNDGLATETRKRVVMRIPFVRLAAHHRETAQWAIPNWWSRQSGHFVCDLPAAGLFARRTRVHVGPAQGYGKYAESSRDDRGDDDLRWHRCAPFSPGARCWKNHITVLILIKFRATISGQRSSVPPASGTLRSAPKPAAGANCAAPRRCASAARADCRSPLAPPA